MLIGKIPYTRVNIIWGFAMLRYFIAIAAWLFAAFAAHAEMPRSADSLVDTIGVNMHVGSNTGPGDYVNDWNIIINAMSTSGIRYVRDYIWDQPTFNTYVQPLITQFHTATGLNLKYMLTQQGTCTPGAANPIGDVNLGLSQTNILGFEGLNEWNGFGSTCGSANSWQLNDKNYQVSLWNTVQGTPAISSLPVIGPSIGEWGDSACGSTCTKQQQVTFDANLIGNLTPYINYGNVHDYCTNTMPSCDFSWTTSGLSVVNGNLPFIVSETGWTNGDVTQAVANNYFSRLFFEWFNYGATKTFVYELLDVPVAGNWEGQFGLLNSNGSPKPAFTTISNIIAILKEPGASVTLTDLPYSMTGGDSFLHHTLLQKSNGTHYLVLWQEHNSWDAFSPYNVTVNFSGATKNVSVYDPTISGAVQSSQTGVTSTTVSITDHAVILALSGNFLSVTSPANNATVSGTISITGTSGSIWLNVACFTTSGTKICPDSAPSGGNFTLSLDTTQIPNGSQTINVTAFSVPAGQAGGTSMTVPLTLNINNTTGGPRYPAPYTCSRNFYVSTAGVDQAGCGGTGSAVVTGAATCASIQGANNNIALQAGDCVNVGPGTYGTTAVINLNKGGSSNQASGYVSYIGAPNHGSLIQWNADSFSGLVFSVPYLIVDGFDFNGNNILSSDILGGAQSQNGVLENINTPIHHLMILNNILRNTRASGFGTANGDYFIIAGNIFHDTATCSQYGQAGMHFLWPTAIPGFSSNLPWDTQYYHIQIIDNIAHDNGWRANSLGGYGTCPPNDDGSGLELDNFQLQNWNNSTAANPGPFPYHTLVAGNIAYNNGSQGIHVGSANNIDVSNNTTYNNGLNNDSRTGGAVPAGYPQHNPANNCEIMLGGSNTNVVNNILFGSTTTSETATLCWISAFGFSEANTHVTNNDFWNGSGSGVVVSGTLNDGGNLSSITTPSANNKLAVNPLLNNPTTDFHPTASSPVLAAGAALPSGVLPGPVPAQDGTPFPSPPPMGALTTAGAAGPNSVHGPVSISAGGPAAAPYIADAGFNGGLVPGNGGWAVDTSLVTNTTPAPTSVYQNQRYGVSFFYVVNGLTTGVSYQVILHFTEDFDTAPGQRQENVSINGVQVLTNFDIIAVTGAQHRAIAKIFSALADSNGAITISFAAIAGLADANAKIDGIQVLQPPGIAGACQ